MTSTEKNSVVNRLTGNTLSHTHIILYQNLQSNAVLLKIIIVHILSIFVIEGLTLMAEAFMSAAYHICPSSSNYQFGKCSYQYVYTTSP